MLPHHSGDYCEHSYKLVPHEMLPIFCLSKTQAETKMSPYKDFCRNMDREIVDVLMADLRVSAGNVNIIEASEVHSVSNY